MSNSKHKEFRYPDRRDSSSEFPSVGEPMMLYGYLEQTSGSYLLQRLIGLITLGDNIISQWLNITTRTFRNYKTKNTKLKENTKEHIASILSLYEHGVEVFSEKALFEQWLISPNPFLDGKAPSDFLDTISGIRLVDNRLTAMEFGENA